MKLQACHECGAQFDVSDYAPGQKFTCGACGAVLTAHVAAPSAKGPAAAAPAARRPGASSAAPRAPATPSRAPGKAPRTPGSVPRTPSKSPRAPARPERTPSKASRTPSKASRAPSRSPSRTAGGPGPAVTTGTRRGPQYQPPERRGDAKAARPAKASAGARAARAPRERPAVGERKGMNPALVYGAGGLVVVAVVLFLVIGGGNGGGEKGGSGTGPLAATPGGTGTANPGATPEPARGPDTLASLKAEAQKGDLDSAGALASLARRFVALGGEEAKTEATALYDKVLKEYDPNHGEARRFLGYTDFQKDILKADLPEGGDPIPPSVSNRKGYPFLQAVTDFNAIRWLKDEDQIQLARDAVAEMKEHIRRLETDSRYRLGDTVRANIAMDPTLGGLNYETYWAAPYLVVYSSSDHMSEFDLYKIEDKKKRREELDKLQEKRKEWHKVLREKGAIFKSTYEEWMRRYAKRFDLKPLDAPWGGREDYDTNDRRFPDGVPMVIWIFTDRDAFHNYHREQLGQNLPPGVAGYFTPRTGWIFLYDEGADGMERVFEINKTVHEATHQLEFWFTRQRNKWREPKPTRDAFSEGIAEFLGSVQMEKDRSLKFIEVNVPRLSMLKQTAQALKNQSGKEYTEFLFPVRELVRFGDYADATNYALSEWGIGNGMGMLYEQGWAFTYFLNNYQNGKYKDNWLKYFEGVLSRQASRQNNQALFMRSFGIRYDDEWQTIQKEWETYFKDVILPMADNLGKWSYQPPKRDDPWPQDPKAE